MFSPLLHPFRLLVLVLALTAFVLVPVADNPETADAADACGTQVLRADGSRWTCTFADDFSGSSLDLTAWTVGDTRISGFTMNGTCFTPGRGYAVTGGNLELTVDRRKAVQCKKPIGSTRTPAVGGAISTYGKHVQTYGRFETRMKFPAHEATGLHGGFWMNPQDRSYGRWPASGEIDVAEWFSAKPHQAYASLHYRGSTKKDTTSDCKVPAIDQFHTYAVEWTASSMKFFYDGKLCIQRTWSPTGMKAPAPFDKPFTTALIAAQGAGWNAPNAKTPKVATTVVDYVKVWK